MPRPYMRDELVERLVRAGELEVSGEDQDEVDKLFDTENFAFHGPDGFDAYSAKTAIPSKPRTISHAGENMSPNPASAHWRASSDVIRREAMPMSHLPVAKSSKAVFEP